jgi:hypothetical protein
MASQFSFGFSGDDIEADENEAGVSTIQIESTASREAPEVTKAQSHRVEDLVSAGFLYFLSSFRAFPAISFRANTHGILLH